MKCSTKPAGRLGLKRLMGLLGGAAALFLTSAAAAAPPERIVSLAPNLTEILYDLGVENRIAAVTDYCDYPPRAASKPKVGGFVNPSLEAIVSLRPDCVVMTEDGNPKVVDRRLRALGIRTHIFRARRIQDLPREIRTMGRVLGIGTMAVTFSSCEPGSTTSPARQICSWLAPSFGPNPPATAFSPSLENWNWANASTARREKKRNGKMILNNGRDRLVVIRLFGVSQMTIRSAHDVFGHSPLPRERDRVRGGCP